MWGREEFFCFPHVLVLQVFHELFSLVIIWFVIRPRPWKLKLVRQMPIEYNLQWILTGFGTTHRGETFTCPEYIFRRKLSINFDIHQGVDHFYWFAGTLSDKVHLMESISNHWLLTSKPVVQIPRSQDYGKMC